MKILFLAVIIGLAIAQPNSLPYPNEVYFKVNCSSPSYLYSLESPTPTSTLYFSTIDRAAAFFYTGPDPSVYNCGYQQVSFNPPICIENVQTVECYHDSTAPIQCPQQHKCGLPISTCRLWQPVTLHLRPDSQTKYTLTIFNSAAGFTNKRVLAPSNQYGNNGNNQYGNNGNNPWSFLQL